MKNIILYDVEAVSKNHRFLKMMSLVDKRSLTINTVIDCPSEEDKIFH